MPSSRQIDSAEDVVVAKPRPFARIGRLDGHAEPTLNLLSPLELLETQLGRGEEEVADPFEEGRAELLEELGARPGETHLGRGRELLAHAAHRAAGRAAGDLPDVASTTSLTPARPRW